MPENSQDDAPDISLAKVHVHGGVATPLDGSRLHRDAMRTRCHRHPLQWPPQSISTASGHKKRPAVSEVDLSGHYEVECPVAPRALIVCAACTNGRASGSSSGLCLSM